MLSMYQGQHVEGNSLPPSVYPEHEVMNRVLVRPSGYPSSLSLTSGSTCLHRLLVHTRVAHHVGGGKVAHHKRILPTLDCINHLQEVMKVKVQRLWQFNMPCTQSTSVRNERDCLRSPLCQHLQRSSLAGGRRWGPWGRAPLVGPRDQMASQSHH